MAEKTRDELKDTIDATIFPNTTGAIIADSHNALLKDVVDSAAIQGEAGDLTAAEVSFDPSGTGMVADDVQEAIEEVNTKAESSLPTGVDRNLLRSVSSTGEQSYRRHPGSLVEVPEGFVWPNEIPNIYRVGESFAIDLTARDHRVTTTTKIFFSPTGDDSNDGLTPAAPKKSIDVYGVPTVPTTLVFAEGCYPYTGTDVSIFQLANFEMVCEDPGLAIFLRGPSGVEFSDDGGNVYKLTGYTTCVNFLDFTVRDKWGAPERLTYVATRAEVVATAGTWSDEGGDCYIRLSDDRTPDKWCGAADHSEGHSASLWLGIRDVDFYGENVAFYGGVAACFTVLEEISGGTHTVGLLRCEFGENGASNAISVNLLRGLVVVERCGAYRAFFDGFNYHSTPWVNVNVYEIDCQSAYCGLDDTGSNSHNGSTAHDGMSLIRINGQHVQSKNRVIHDIGDGTIWMLGTRVVGPSGRASDLDGGIACGTAGDSTEMWLDSCVVEGFASPEKDVFLYSETTGKIHYRGMELRSWIDATDVTSYGEPAYHTFRSLEDVLDIKNNPNKMLQVSGDGLSIIGAPGAGGSYIHIPTSSYAPLLRFDLGANKITTGPCTLMVDVKPIGENADGDDMGGDVPTPLVPSLISLGSATSMLSTAPFNQFLISLRENFGMYLYWYQGNASTKYERATSSQWNIRRGIRAKYVITKDGATEPKFYLAGVLFTFDNNNDVGPPSPSYDLDGECIQLGINYNLVDSNLVCKYYAAAAWNRVLSDAEILALETEPVNTFSNGLILDYVASDNQAGHGAFNRVDGKSGIIVHPGYTNYAVSAAPSAVVEVLAPAASGQLMYASGNFLPINARIDSIRVANPLGSSVTAVSIGTTNGGSDIVSSGAVTADATTDLTLAKQVCDTGELYYTATGGSADMIIKVAYTV